MPDPPRSPGTGDHTGVGSDPGSITGPPRTPRWVKVTGIIALLVALGIAILLATGGPGAHGPRRHTPAVLGGPTLGVFPAHQGADGP